MVTAKVGALRQSRQMYDLISIASICNFYLHCQFQTSPGFTYLFKIMFSLIQTLFEKVKLSLTHRGLVTHMRPWTGSLLVMIVPWSLRWRHNGHDSVTNHQPHHCLLNRLLGCRSKKTSKLRVNGLCAGNSPVRGQWRGKCFHLTTSSWIGTKTMPEPIIHQQFSANVESKCTNVFQEKLFENVVCKMSAMSFRLLSLDSESSSRWWVSWLLFHRLFVFSSAN